MRLLIFSQSVKLCFYQGKQFLRAQADRRWIATKPVPLYPSITAHPLFCSRVWQLSIQ